MKTVEVLTAAREKIADPNNWTKGHLYGTRIGARPYHARLLAKGAKASGVSTLAAANCFCAVGAVGAACGVQLREDIDDAGKIYLSVLQDGKVTPVTFNAFNRAAKYLNAAVWQLQGGGGFSRAYMFNDSPTTTHTDVLKAFDLAIRNAKRRHINGGR